MNGQRAADSDMRSPSFVIAACRFFTVTTIDEQKTQRRGPRCADARRPANEADHRVFETSVVDRCAKEGQGVHLADALVNHFGIVMFPSGLVLL